MNYTILQHDLAYTWERLTSADRKKLLGATILITGCGGFLGQYHMSFFERYGQELAIKQVIGIDTFLLGESPLIKRLRSHPLFDIRSMDIKNFSDCDIIEKYKVDYVLHMASIASPTYYRLHPMETIESNVWGIKALLDAFSGQPLKGFLFYSSSEVYGDPDPNMVPTDEEYRGNVSCVGPRACYDEAKRFGETLCWAYYRLYSMPIRIVRLFNVYGPGLKLNDRRAPADFADAVIGNKDIAIYSNGQPQRTFCYVADSTVGELKALLYDKFDIFNIGSASEELSIAELAQLYKKVGQDEFGYTGEIVYKTSDDADYLVHDPQRRCPDISKAERLLGYMPTIGPEAGIKRYLQHIKEEGVDAVW